MKKHFIKFISFFMAIFILIPTISLADTFGVEDKFTSYLVINSDSGEILGEYESEKVLPIASITKLMTYNIVKDSIKAGKISLTDQVTITKEMAEIPGSSFNLKEGEVLTVDDLLKGMLVVSGNDAAKALAITVGGNEEAFVKLMNKKVEEIGLEHAKFYNASGYPVDDKENEMSTKDICKMTDYILKEYPEILDYSKIRILDYPSRGFKRKSSIPLLGEVKGVDGLKTGTTDKAGHCVVTTMKVNENTKEKPYRVIIVAMGASSKEERDKADKYIAEYIRQNFGIVNLTTKDEEYSTLRVNSSQTRDVKVYVDETVTKMVDKSKGINYVEKVDDNIKAPFKAGEKIGTLTIMNGGKPVKEVGLVVKEDYKKASFFTRVRRSLSWAFRLTRELLYV